MSTSVYLQARERSARGVLDQQTTAVEVGSMGEDGKLSSAFSPLRGSADNTEAGYSSLDVRRLLMYLQQTNRSVDACFERSFYHNQTSRLEAASHTTVMSESDQWNG